MYFVRSRASLERRIKKSSSSDRIIVDTLSNGDHISIKDGGLATLGIVKYTKADLYGTVVANVGPETVVRLHDATMAYVRSSKSISAYDQSAVFIISDLLTGESVVESHDRSTVISDSGSVVHAYDHSHIVAFGSSLVYAYDDVTVVAFDDSVIYLNQNAKCAIRGERVLC